MSERETNFCLFLVSNLSVQNLRIFLLMYPGSVSSGARSPGHLVSGDLPGPGTSWTLQSYPLPVCGGISHYRPRLIRWWKYGGSGRHNRWTSARHRGIHGASEYSDQGWFNPRCAGGGGGAFGGPQPVREFGRQLRTFYFINIFIACYFRSGQQGKSRDST